MFSSDSFLLPLSGASPAGECSPAEDGVRWWEGWSHCMLWAWSNAVLEGATDILRGVPCPNNYWDRQAEVLWHGPWPDHLDGHHYLSNRDRRETQVIFVSRAYFLCPYMHIHTQSIHASTGESSGYVITSEMSSILCIISGMFPQLRCWWIITKVLRVKWRLVVGVRWSALRWEKPCWLSEIQQQKRWRNIK